MRHRYSYLDPDLIRQLLAEMGLRRLFNHLLLQSGGDVEEAMRWMRALQDRGYIDPNIDLEAFFAQLMEENVIGQDANGNVVLGAGGERQIRRDALDEIFGGLQKSLTGSHSVANAGQGTRAADGDAAVPVRRRSDVDRFDPLAAERDEAHRSGRRDL